jgi:hypothetical protein
MIDLETLAKLNLKVTKGAKRDSPILEDLIKHTPEGSGEFVADSAHLSRRNLELAAKKGGTPYIKPEKSARLKAKGSQTRRTMIKQHKEDREELDKHCLKVIVRWAYEQPGVLASRTALEALHKVPEGLGPRHGASDVHLLGQPPVGLRALNVMPTPPPYQLLELPLRVSDVLRADSPASIHDSMLLLTWMTRALRPSSLLTSLAASSMREALSTPPP